MPASTYFTLLKNTAMKVFSFLSFLIFSAGVYSQNIRQLNNKKITLPNGWSLSPAGKSLPLGDLPLNLVVSKSGNLIAVTNNGQSTQTIQLINAITEKQLDEVTIAKSWYGLKFSADEKKLYASGGNDNWILQYNIIQNKLILADSFLLGKKMKELISPAGIEVDDAAQKMYVVTKENNSLYIVDLKSKEVLQKIKLDGEAYSCLLSKDKKTLYISCWGCDKIILFDTKLMTIRQSIAVGDNPNELIINKKKYTSFCCKCK